MEYDQPFRVVAFRHRELEFDVVGPSTGTNEDTFQELLQKILHSLIKCKKDALEEMEESSSSSSSPNASVTAGSSPDMSESDADYSQSSDDEDCGFEKVDTLFGEAIKSIATDDAASASKDSTEVVSAVASPEVPSCSDGDGEDEDEDDEVSLSSLSCEFNADDDADTEDDGDDGDDGDDDVSDGEEPIDEVEEPVRADFTPPGNITYIFELDVSNVYCIGSYRQCCY
jgi:hypothetical protein